MGIKPDLSGAEHTLRVFRNRMMWGIFGHKRDEVTRDCIVRNSMVHTLQRILLR
jgi:hypothetical protein